MPIETNISQICKFEQSSNLSGAIFDCETGYLLLVAHDSNEAHEVSRRVQGAGLKIKIKSKNL